MTKDEFYNLKIGDVLQHRKGYTVTIEHKNEDPFPGIDTPVFWADCLGSLAVVTRPDLWEKLA